jgi:hypothetical protein
MTAGFRSNRELVDAMLNGQAHEATFRKAYNQSTTSNWWTDLSMIGSQPVANYYASDPLVGATLLSRRGIFHGDDKSPARKYLTRWALSALAGTQVPGEFVLADYLLYYPFIDLDDTSAEQPLENPVPLPRYADGLGVEVMFVAVSPTTGGGSFTFAYTDENGAAQISPVITINTSATVIGNVLTSQPAVAFPGTAWLPTLSRGIRSITGVTMISGGGGLGCFVLVMPLATHSLQEGGSTSEIEYLSMRGPQMPRIYDGAYLNLIGKSSLAAWGAGILMSGHMSFAWN